MKHPKAIAAINDLAKGYNCSQSIIHQFYQDLDISEETALKIASGFGGGMRLGHTCGIISGSIMVLSLKFGHSLPGKEHKEKLYNLVKSFTDDFIAVHNTTFCKELLGVDTSKEEGRNQAKKSGLYESLCPVFMETAIILLEEKLNTL